MVRTEIETTGNDFENWKNRNERILRDLDKSYIPHPFTSTGKRKVTLRKLAEGTAKDLISTKKSKVPEVVLVTGPPGSGKSHLSRYFKGLFKDIASEKFCTINWDQSEEIAKRIINLRLKYTDNRRYNEWFYALIKRAKEETGILETFFRSRFFEGYFPDPPDAPDEDMFLQMTNAYISFKLDYKIEKQISSNQAVCIVADILGGTSVPLRNSLFQTRAYADKTCEKLRNEWQDRISLTYIGLGPGPGIYPRVAEQEQLPTHAQFGGTEQRERGRLSAWAAMIGGRNKLSPEVLEFIDLVEPDLARRPLTAGEIAEIVKSTSLKKLILQSEAAAAVLGRHPNDVLFQSVMDIAATSSLEKFGESADRKGVFITNPAI